MRLWVSFFALILPLQLNASAQEAFANDVWEINDQKTVASTVYIPNLIEYDLFVGVTSCSYKDSTVGPTVTLSVRDNEILDEHGATLFDALTTDGRFENSPSYGLVMTFSDGTRNMYQFSHTNQQDGKLSRQFTLTSFVNRSVVKKFKSQNTVTFTFLIDGKVIEPPVLEPFRLEKSGNAINQLQSC
jgi:hypothetical protein